MSKIPEFNAQASLYKSDNHYRSGAGGSYASNGDATLKPQGCGWVKGGVCGTFIAGGVVVCTASCLASPALGGIPCWVCWTGFLGGTFGFCRDCIPGWMRALLDLAEGGGGSGGGGTGGGGGGGPTRGPCGCPKGTKCCGGCTKIPGQGLVCNDICIGPGEQCP